MVKLYTNSPLQFRFSQGWQLSLERDLAHCSKELVAMTKEGTSAVDKSLFRLARDFVDKVPMQSYYKNCEVFEWQSILRRKETRRIRKALGIQKGQFSLFASAHQGVKLQFEKDTGRFQEGFFDIGLNRYFNFVKYSIFHLLLGPNQIYNAKSKSLLNRKGFEKKTSVEIQLPSWTFLMSAILYATKPEDRVSPIVLTKDEYQSYVNKDMILKLLLSHHAVFPFQVPTESEQMEEDYQVHEFLLLHDQMLAFAKINSMGKNRREEVLNFVSVLKNKLTNEEWNHAMVDQFLLKVLWGRYSSVETIVTQWKRIIQDQRIKNKHEDNSDVVLLEAVLKKMLS